VPINTPNELREHLELAIQVELSAIPPYLFAMYSIEDSDSEAALLIRSIVAEEMLHAALATNVLLAIGGNPRFDTTELIPSYPGSVPHHRPPLELNLAPCSLELVRDVFMRLEQPEARGALPEADEFETLGQFYHGLEGGIVELAKHHDLFSDVQPERQLADPAFYQPVAYDAEDSGGLGLVTGVDSALDALEVIVHQGEGLSTERWADPDHQELTHYHKLLQISTGISPLGPVRALKPNPRTAQFPERLQGASNLFNAGYRWLFFVLGELFSPLPDKSDSVRRLYVLMSDVLSPLASLLVRSPIGAGQFAGPTFEIYEFDRDPGEELLALAEQVAAGHPDLIGLRDVIEGLGLDGAP
jgi:hypothetical protein